MGMAALDVPMIDTVGSHVTYISGVIFERLGREVLAIRYLDTTCQGVTTREIVGKDAMSIEALADNAERARIFLVELAKHPVKSVSAH